MTKWFTKLIDDLKELFSDGEYHTTDELYKKCNDSVHMRKALKWLNNNWRYKIIEAYKMEVILDG